MTFLFAWYSVGVTFSSTDKASTIATVKDEITGGTASFAGSESRYKFDKTAADAAAAFLPASNNTAVANTLTGDLATVTSAWIHKVQVGDSAVDAETGSNAAYAVITGTLTITTAATQNLGSYVVTLEAGEDYGDVDDYFVILAESDFGSDSFSSWNGTSKTYSKAVNTVAGTYSFKVVLWLNGTLSNANLPATNLSGKEIIKLSAVYTPGA